MSRPGNREADSTRTANRNGPDAVSERAVNIGGSVIFEAALPETSLVDEMEKVLKIALDVDRRDAESTTYRGEALGLTLFLTLDQGPDFSSGTLSYRTANAYRQTEADVVDLDFHFVEVLHSIGLRAWPAYPAGGEAS